MQKLRFLLPLLFLSLLVLGQAFPEKPNPPRLVNDFGDILTPQQEQQLEQKLLRYSDTTSTQITIIVLAEELQDDENLYAAELGQKWKVGQEGVDNGLVFLVAPKGENRQISIQNGYGLEPVLTDALTKRIIEQYILPEFRNDNYYKGIDAGTDQIFKLLAGEFEGKGSRRGQPKKSIPFFVLIIIIIMVVVGLRGRRGGGPGSGHRGGGAYWIGGLGGGLGGSSGGFGGGGGGGFGGFGGGSFGGGGASGSW